MMNKEMLKNCSLNELTAVQSIFKEMHRLAVSHVEILKGMGDLCPNDWIIVAENKVHSINNYLELLDLINPMG